jgi:hypothetical protein
MFRKTWFRAALVLTILASLVAAPLYVSAQAENGITSPADGATISGTVTLVLCKIRPVLSFRAK